jgi:hypothetical protein
LEITAAIDANTNATEASTCSGSYALAGFGIISVEPSGIYTDLLNISITQFETGSGHVGEQRKGENIVTVMRQTPAYLQCYVSEYA